MFADADVDDVTLTQIAEKVEQSVLEEIPKCSYLNGESQSDEWIHDNIHPSSSTTAMYSDREAAEPWEGKPRNYASSPVVLLTAPTGKAASHLGRKCGLPAFTLHQVIYSYWSWKKSAENEKNLPWKFSAVRALVVDESSLVSVVNFHTVFSTLLGEADLKKVVLLGDINQLPSIEPGNFLVDLYKALSPYNCCVLLRHNHRTESELIVENAGQIAEQKLPIFDENRNFIQINLDDHNDDISIGKFEHVIFYGDDDFPLYKSI